MSERILLGPVSCLSPGPVPREELLALLASAALMTMRLPHFAISPGQLIFCALASKETEAVVDFYPLQAEAEAGLEEALSDVRDWVDLLYVVPVELSAGTHN
jgi:hypothetical protein